MADALTSVLAIVALALGRAYGWWFLDPAMGIVGGLLIGIVQSLMSTIWPPGASLMIYIAMAAVLLLRPHGLLGRST